MGRTLLYCRKSKKSQEGVADTIDSQEAELRRFAESRGWSPVEVLVEHGISAGRKAEHKRRVFYGQIVPAIQSGDVDRLLVVDYDRLHRYLSSFLSFIETVAQPNGAEVWVTRRNQDACQASIIELAMHGGLSEQESKVRSDRQKGHRDRMRAAGRARSGGSRSFGFEPDGVTVRPDEAALIRESASMLLAGDSLRAVTIRWQQAGMLSARGNPVAPTSIRRCLMHTPLLDEDTREKLRGLFNDPSRKKGGFNRRSYLLTGGIARCSHCGEKLVAHPGYDPETQKSTKRRYACMMRVSDQVNGCGRVKADAAELERAVLDVLSAGLAQEKLAEQVASLSPMADPAEIGAKRRAIQEQTERLEDRLVDGTLTKTAYLRQRARLDAKLIELDSRSTQTAHLAIAERRSAVWAEYADRRDYLNDPAAFDWWRGLIEELVQYVEVSDDAPPIVGLKDTVSVVVAGDHD